MDYVEIINTARQITGNVEGKSSAESWASDEAVEAGMAEMVRRLVEKVGASSAVKQVVLNATAGNQQYALSAIAGDVSEIEFVVRPGLGQACYDASDFHPVTGLPTHPFGSSWTDSHDRLMLDAMSAKLRGSQVDDRDFEVLGGDLWLYPCPSRDERVLIRYTSTGGTLSSLPSKATQAAVLAACVSIFDTLLNKLMSDTKSRNITGGAEGDATRINERMKLIERQRDRYESRFQAELGRL